MAAFVRALVARYNYALEQYPMSSKIVTGGVLFAAGDALCQKAEGLQHDKKEQKHPFDYARTARMATFGGLVFGPAGHFWYKFLDTRYPKTDTRTIITKVALDQFVFAPPFYGSFYLLMSLMEGQTLAHAIATTKRNFLPTYAVDFCVWPGAQFVNFRFFAPQNRVLFVSGVSVFWNAFLSMMQHR